MRLFLALDVPPSQKVLLSGLQRSLIGGRHVPFENFHVTLAFLGDSVAEEMAEDLHEQLENTGWSAMTLCLQGFGHFGHETLRAIWVGLAPSGALLPLHERLVTLSRKVGLSLPRRRFVPHVTLARYPRGDHSGSLDFAKLIQMHAPFSGEAFRPTAFHLMCSRLKPEGPEYEVLASYPLR